MFRLYDYLKSGNGYKVRLLLTQLGLPFKLLERDILLGETRTHEFLAKNPNGRIPLLEFEDGRLLWESNAILWYLAQGSQFLPLDPFQRAQVMQWMCFEQYSHEPHIATIRFWTFSETLDAHAHELEQRRELGYAALDVMESHLHNWRFFVGDSYSIADISLYAYTHVAEQGDFALERYTAIRAWMARVREQPNHILITDRFEV